MAEIQYYGTGRRKSATARVYLRPGSGEFKVNQSPIDIYFKNETLRMIIRQPLQLTDTVNKFDVVVNVDGGGTAKPACPAEMRIAWPEQGRETRVARAARVGSGRPPVGHGPPCR